MGHLALVRLLAKSSSAPAVTSVAELCKMLSRVAVIIDDARDLVNPRTEGEEGRDPQTSKMEEEWRVSHIGQIEPHT